MSIKPRKHQAITRLLSRRRFLKKSALLAWMAASGFNIPSYAAHNLKVSNDNGIVDLVLGRHTLTFDDREGETILVNKTLPGPLIRLKEGKTAKMRVTNALDVNTSIHWHGLILPSNMDGVPGLSFAGIKPGETFLYQIPIRQSGTYWYHSHWGLQEQSGVYGPLIIDPIEPDPYQYDRDYVVMLSDWTPEDPSTVIANLKKQSNYYNYQQRTFASLAKNAIEQGWTNTLANRLMWGTMRMDPTDFADVTGATYSFLVNGQTVNANWTGLFHPGEKIRLRFINASAMSYFDVRIPGLKMTVVQADGQNVQPMAVDEFRIAVAETYDVIVQPASDQAYTIFAEAMDRSGYARGTLATRYGQTAAIPKRRQRPLRTMTHEGMDHHHHQKTREKEREQSFVQLAEVTPEPYLYQYQAHHTGHPANRVRDENALFNKTYRHETDKHGPGAAMVARTTRSRIHEPGDGLENNGRRVLVYSDLRRLKAAVNPKSPSTTIEVHLTGNMERYMWSFDGKKYSEIKDPIHFSYGERVRLVLWNDTMMDHPIHLHGMWMEIDNGAGNDKPRKHTVNVKPGERLAVEIDADSLGEWAFHCHLLYHMKMGMFREVVVS